MIQMPILEQTPNGIRVKVGRKMYLPGIYLNGYAAEKAAERYYNTVNSTPRVNTRKAKNGK